MAGASYLDRFRQLLMESRWFGRDEVEKIIRIARGYAGGKARGESYARRQEFASIEELTPDRLKDMGKAELLNMHRRLHAIFHAPNRPSVETLANAHEFVIAEFERRGLNHWRRDELDEKGLPKEASDGEVSDGQEEKKEEGQPARGGQEGQVGQVLVPDYISVVGSAVADPASAEDIDVLVRDEEPEGGWRESVLLRVRQLLDPGKAGKGIHLVFNPQGPHGDYLPLADLVLQPKAQAEVRHIAAGGEPKQATMPKEEDETRGVRAERLWADNWWKAYPSSGKGRFTYHHHWRGLSEEESKLGEKALLETDHSVHGDLRLEGADALFGFTVFLGAAEFVRGGRDLDNLSPDDRLQVVPKLAQPEGWLEVGKRAPAVVEPEEAGATVGKYAKFFAHDSGDYEVGVWREHAQELFLHGGKLKGRYTATYAPVGEGGRKWLIGRPADQTPIAERTKLEAVMAELKAKGQRHLVWAQPGERPKLLKLSESERKEAVLV